MTKGTKIFRIVICVLLALNMIWSAFLGVALLSDRFRESVIDEKYGLWITNVRVTSANAEDVLGDGTVHYDAYDNILTFENALIESEHTIIYSVNDLNVRLIGENKFICKNESHSFGIYAGDSYIHKDLAIHGDGSLTIEMTTKSNGATGIFADDLMVNSDITIITPDCEFMTTGIVCDSSLIVVNKATVTVNNGAATHSMGVRVRGNALFEEGTALNVSVKSGATESCEGLNVIGDLFMEKNTALNISIGDEFTESGECIRVNGLMDIGADSKVTASAKNAHAIACYGSLKVNEGAMVSAVSDKKDSDIFCSGTVVNYVAEIDAEIDALGGIHNRAEN
jgi:hypothetical protein